jgi:hypothetical protein
VLILKGIVQSHNEVVLYIGQDVPLGLRSLHLAAALQLALLEDLHGEDGIGLLVANLGVG